MPAPARRRDAAPPPAPPERPALRALRQLPAGPALLGRRPVPRRSLPGLLSRPPGLAVPQRPRLRRPPARTEPGAAAAAVPAAELGVNSSPRAPGACSPPARTELNRGWQPPRWRKAARRRLRRSLLLEKKPNCWRASWAS